MRQKYLISRNLERNVLRIMEYAVLNKDLNKVASEKLHRENFSLLVEETYESEIIKKSISLGNNALVKTLRTHNIFPISPYACKIAETIRELYSLSEDGDRELFFDDMDLIPAE
jgi:hypothetical protein